MSQSGPASTTAKHRARAFLVSLCALAGALPLPCLAGRVVRVYEVAVEGQSAAAVQDAMRQALVRATGRRESANDPALASVVAEASRYLKGYAVGPRGESQVVFDGAAVDQAITAAGRGIWDRERPFTLVVLIPPRPRAAEDAARAELERVAAERGLPISLLPLAVVGTDGNLLAPLAILESAQRYGGDQVLIGRGDPNAPDTEADRASPADPDLSDPPGADLADRRHAARRPPRARARIVHGGGRIGRTRRLSGQTLQLDIRARQDPRSGGRQAAAGHGVRRVRVARPHSLVADGGRRRAGCADRARRVDLSALVRAAVRCADADQQAEHRCATRLRDVGCFYLSTET